MKVNLRCTLPTGSLKDISKEVGCVFLELCFREDSTRRIEVSSTQSWKQNFQEALEKEPPECWDLSLSNGTSSHKPPATKVCRGAATLVPKVLGTAKKQPALFKQASDFTLHFACNKCLQTHKQVTWFCETMNHQFLLAVIIKSPCETGLNFELNCWNQCFWYSNLSGKCDPA